MRTGSKWLFLVATSATLLLMLLSDPTPPAAETFAQASNANGTITLICQVVAVQERPNGTTLTLVDATQAQAKAFMPRSLGPPPSVGQVVRVALAPSGRSAFYFIEGLAYP